MWRWVTCLLLSTFFLSLAGCDRLQLPRRASETPAGPTALPSNTAVEKTTGSQTPTAPLPNGSQTSTPHAQDTLVAEKTPDTQPTSETSQKLVIWLPPQFDPSANNTAAEYLRAQIQEFSRLHNDLKIEVRLKADAGPGGMLEALAATNAAAPGALPDLVALSRPDLEIAALKGLIYPMEEQARLADDPDWYSYARQLAVIQGSAFGLPFAGDALVLLYRSSQVQVIPKDWATLMQQPGALAFPAADPQALLTLALYQSAGGQVEDAQRRPMIAVNALTTVLKLYESGVKSSKLPPWLAQSESDGQAWQSYREQQAVWVVTWASRYLADLPADTALLPMLPMGNTSFTLATGWLWALATPRPEKRALAVELVDFLVKSDFLSRWTAAAGFLPPRPSALTGWKNQSLQGTLSQIELSANAHPGNDLLAVLGPLLKDAVQVVIKGQSDPVQAAQAAAEHLKSP
jgi:multiple sugar transport system substrate-binding protein